MENTKELSLSTELEKFAQKRRLRSRLRKNFNLTGKALEALNREYREVVQAMNKVDEKIRQDAENLKLILKEARSLARRRDYFAAASNISEFHEKTNLINARLKNFSVKLKDDHYRFLLKNLNTLDKSRLLSYDPTKDIELVDDGETDGLVAEANVIGDFWHNIFNQNSKAMKALETKFSKSFMSELREATFDIISQAEQMFEYLVQVFDELGSAWSVRDVGSYVRAAEQYSDRFKDFHKLYLDYHSKYVSRLQETNAQIQAEEEAAEAKKTIELAKTQPVSTPANVSQTQQMEHKPVLEPPLQSEETPELPSSRQGPSTPDPFVHHPDWDDERKRKWMENHPGQRVVPKEVLLKSVAPVPAISPPSPPPSSAPPPAASEEQSIPTSRLFSQFAPKKPTTPQGRDFQPISTQTPTEIGLGPKTLRSGELPKRSTQEFINQLSKYSSVSSILQEILKYSQEIEDFNAEDSLKLLSIVEGFAEKTAAEPKKTKKKDLKLTEEKASVDPLLQYNQPGIFKAVEHGIPEKDYIGQRWSEFPFLKGINSSNILIPGKDSSGNSLPHLLKKLEQVFIHSSLDVAHLPDFGNRLLDALKDAITRGLLVSNVKCGIGSRANDCMLRVFSYVNLNDLYPNLNKRLEFIASLRLDIINGTIQFTNITDLKIK